MVVKVTFPSSNIEYHYIVGKDVEMDVGQTYQITNDCNHTYNNSVVVTGFIESSRSATRTITKAVRIHNGKVVETKQKVENTPRSRKAPRMADLVKNILFNGPATIVFWTDGTKTMVKCHEEDVYDKSKAIALCFMKKMFGNTSEFNEVLRKYDPEVYEEVEEPKAPVEEPNVFLSNFGDSPLFNMFDGSGSMLTNTKSNYADNSIQDAIETLMKIFKECSK